MFNVIQLCVTHLFNAALKAAPVFSKLMTVYSLVGIYKILGDLQSPAHLSAPKLEWGFLRNSDTHTHTHTHGPQRHIAQKTAL